jgi:hypothetical protein
VDRIQLKPYSPLQHFPLARAENELILILILGLGRAMSRPEDYRLRATTCLSLANAATEAAERYRLLDYALYWFRLAELAGKSHDLDLAEVESPRRRGSRGQQSRSPSPFA